MINKKIKVSFITLLVFSFFSAQTQKIGINKDNAQFNLDVKGTVRIENVEGINASAVPLGWDSTNNQVVELYIDKSNVDKKQFYRVNYKISLNGDRDYNVKGLDLGIDTNKFDVFLLEHHIELNGYGRGVLPRPVARGKRGGQVYSKNVYVPSGNGRKGALRDENNAGSETNLIRSENANTEDGIIRMGHQEPEAKVVLEEGKFKFYGGFKGDMVHTNYKPFGNTLSPQKYIWYFTVLVIDKEWAKTATDITQ